MALAIRDFSDQTPDCDVIDITGADSAYEKGEQKSRIYAELFRANGMNTGFTMKQYGGKLYLIRTGIRGRTADATGVKDVWERSCKDALYNHTNVLCIYNVLIFILKLGYNND